MKSFNIMTSSEGAPLPKRVCLRKEELDILSKEELIEKWLLQDQYINSLKLKTGESENLELVSLRESEEKLKQQQLEATRKENILVMRLTTKEQEMQEYASQIQELKQSALPSLSQLRAALLDPAVNAMFERMRKEVDSLKARLEETQNELSAWKFTPDRCGTRATYDCLFNAAFSIFSSTTTTTTTTTGLTSSKNWLLFIFLVMSRTLMSSKRKFLPLLYKTDSELTCR